jgi:hypothetical protein
MSCVVVFSFLFLSVNTAGVCFFSLSCCSSFSFDCFLVPLVIYTPKLRGKLLFVDFLCDLDEGDVCRLCSPYLLELINSINVECLDCAKKGLKTKVIKTRREFFMWREGRGEVGLKK